jgi:histidinol dehydrogenase
VIERFDADDPAALRRPAGREDPALLDAVRAIVADIRARGWDALAEQALRIDGAAPELVAVAPFA